MQKKFATLWPKLKNGSFPCPRPKRNQNAVHNVKVATLNSAHNTGAIPNP